ncbi:hypothetical protein DMP23_06255 [Amycolatopsis sp. A1MSW2902]
MRRSRLGLAGEFGSRRGRGIGTPGLVAGLLSALCRWITGLLSGRGRRTMGLRALGRRTIRLTGRLNGPGRLVVGLAWLLSGPGCRAMGAEVSLTAVGRRTIGRVTLPSGPGRRVTGLAGRLATPGCRTIGMARRLNGPARRTGAVTRAGRVRR